MEGFLGLSRVGRLYYVYQLKIENVVADNFNRVVKVILKVKIAEKKNNLAYHFVIFTKSFSVFYFNCYIKTI